MEMPEVLRLAFPPAPDRLLDQARLEVDDDMLGVIARADYGMNADEVMPELRAIRDRGVLPTSMSFALGEVLSLTRYSQPEPSTSPGSGHRSPATRGHSIRRFACAVLLRMDAEPAFAGWDAADATLARCLASVAILGDSSGDSLARFLTWRIPRPGPEAGPMAWLAPLGLLTLATRLRRSRLTEPDLGLVAGWVLAREAADRGRFPLTHAGPPPAPFSVGAGFWDPIVARFVADARAIGDPAVRDDLLLCSLLLEPDGA